MRVVEAELVRGEKERGSEALDLERPSELAPERVGEAVGSKQREGRDDERDDRHERARGGHGLTSPVAAGDVHERRRKQNERIDLRGGRQTEHGEREALPAGEKRRECGRRQGRRPEVVARENDRAEQEREEPDQDGRGEDPAR